MSWWVCDVSEVWVLHTGPLRNKKMEVQTYCVRQANSSIVRVTLTVSSCIIDFYSKQVPVWP